MWRLVPGATCWRCLPVRPGGSGGSHVDALIVNMCIMCSCIVVPCRLAGIESGWHVQGQLVGGTRISVQGLQLLTVPSAQLQVHISAGCSPALGRGACRLRVKSYEGHRRREHCSTA
jgi:hypothetical protein